jgi:hypothetical protein
MWRTDADNAASKEDEGPLFTHKKTRFSRVELAKQWVDKQGIK